MKTSELTGAALDWAVAKCEGWTLVHGRAGDEAKLRFERTDSTGIFRKERWELAYSTAWAQGGPIIEREEIAARKSKGKWYAMLSADLGDGERAQWCQYTFRDVPRTASCSRRCRFDAPTALIAAMRCYVASKLGEEVEVLDELA